MTRTLTALVFVAVVLGASYFQYGYFILFALLSAFTTLEFLRITKQLREERQNSFLRKTFTVFINLCIYALALATVFYGAEVRYWFIVPALLFGLFILELYAKSETPFVNLAVNISAVVYIGLPFAMLHYIVYQNGAYQFSLLYGILFMIWIYDAGAYLVGSKIGKTPLFKRISPNKTIEGLAGGLVVLVLLSFILGQLFPVLTTWNWVVLSIIIAYFSATGDLIESMLKRSLKIKDSGNILPGHGGLLDRFDAFIFVLPFIALYLALFVQ